MEAYIPTSNMGKASGRKKEDGWCKPPLRGTVYEVIGREGWASIANPILILQSFPPLTHWSIESSLRHAGKSRMQATLFCYVCVRARLSPQSLLGSSCPAVPIITVTTRSTRINVQLSNGRLLASWEQQIERERVSLNEVIGRWRRRKKNEKESMAGILVSCFRRSLHHHDLLREWPSVATQWIATRAAQ